MTTEQLDPAIFEAIEPLADFRQWPKEIVQAVGAQIGDPARAAIALTKMRLFLNRFAVTGNVREAIYAAQTSNGTLRRWRADFPWFDEMFHDALTEAADLLEQEARRRALSGYEDPVIYQGQMTMVVDPETGMEKPLTVRKYSDSLMALMLKGMKPDRYRDRQQVEHTTADGAATGVLIVPATPDLKTWSQIAEEQQAKYNSRRGNVDVEGGTE